MFRKSFLIAYAVASVAFVSSPASAADKDLGNLNKDKVDGICGEKGGTTWATPDGNNYGCGYEGGGGIICDKETGCLEITRSVPDSDKPWGLAGLLGLVGLLGLTRRRRHRSNHDVGTNGRV
jgi:MYXO-CTERM domain-containing protein